MKPGPSSLPTAAPPVPRSTYCYDAFPTKERFDVWSESVSPLFRPRLAEKGRPEMFGGTTDVFLLDRTVFGLSVVQGISGYVSTGNSALHDGAELFVIQLYTRGGFVGTNGGRDLAVTPGDIVILDSTRSMTTSVVDSALLSLIVPRPIMLEALGGGADPLPGVIRGASVTGTILGDAFRSVWQRLPDTAMADASATSGFLIGTLSGLLRGTADRATPAGSAVEKARLNAMRNYIARHLAEPSLGPDLLCLRFNCARATLYRLFAPVGGVGNYIRQARLQRAYVDLLKSGSDNVIDVAFRWGFSSHSHFTRAFREAFGITPREAGELGRSARLARETRWGQQRSAEWLPDYRDWLTQL